MKSTILIACASALIISCNSKTESPDKTDKDTTSVVSTEKSDVSAEKIDYAYIPANHPPDNWLPGDQKNVAMVLKSLKAFETGNIDEALMAFADSVQWSGDGYDDKMSKEDMKKAFTDAWSKMSSMKIEMNDYETVVSKDKKNNWVSLWYKQIVTDKSGKTDSIFYMDDLKIENGKITILDEKQRRYPAPKK
jgi:hypothetical protein